VLAEAAAYAGATGRLNIVGVVAVAACAAIAGDNAGYWLGRFGGPRVIARFGRLLRLDDARLRLGRYLFDRHGAAVVIGGRFASLLRCWVAFLAGVNQMRWSRFLAADAAGVAARAAMAGFGAYALGTAASAVGQTVTLVALAVTTLLAVAVALVTRRRIADLLARSDGACPAAPHRPNAPELV
jgi:membrane protein DedA with SNARE-associated domain